MQQFHADFVSTYLFVHSSALRGGNQYCWPPVTSAGSRCHNMSFGPDHPVSRALDGDPRGKSHTKQSSPFNHTPLCVFICRISARLSRAPLRDAPAHPRCTVSGGCSAPTSRLTGDAEFGPRRRRSGNQLDYLRNPNQRSRTVGDHKAEGIRRDVIEISATREPATTPTPILKKMCGEFGSTNRFLKHWRSGLPC